MAGSGTWVDAATRYTNTTGTPLVSAVSNDDGQLVADKYSLSFASVVAGVSAQVTVTGQSPNNPNNNSGAPITVNLDGTTQYKNIIRGVTLVFSSSGSFVNTWAAEVRCGHYFGSFAAFGAGAGVPSTGRRIRVSNTGSGPATNCKARLVKMAKLWKKTGSVFSRVFPFAESATEKLTGNQVVKYAITVANVTGSGGSKTYDVLVDSATVTVTNLNTGASVPSTGLNVNDTYRITSGGLNSVEFKLDQNCVAGDTANILIFAARFMQIAEDVSGSAGTYGTADVNLTQSGQATGTINASGTAFYWVRVLVPDGGNSESNPHPGDTQLSGQVSSSAGWTA